jgi:hypothetical protein
MKEIIKKQVQEFVAVCIARNSSFYIWRWLDECAFHALTTTHGSGSLIFKVCTLYSNHITKAVPESCVLLQSRTP